MRPKTFGSWKVGEVTCAFPLEGEKTVPKCQVNSGEKTLKRL